MAFVCKLSQLFQFAANRADKNPDRGPYRKKLGAGAPLANQIRGFEIPARGDAPEKNKYIYP